MEMKFALDLSGAKSESSLHTDRKLKAPTTTTTTTTNGRVNEHLPLSVCISTNINHHLRHCLDSSCRRRRSCHFELSVDVVTTSHKGQPLSGGKWKATVDGENSTWHVDSLALIRMIDWKQGH